MAIQSRRKSRPSIPTMKAVPVAAEEAKPLRSRKVTASDLTPPRPHPWGIETLPVVKLLGNFAVGVGFGVALQKGQLFEPVVIQGQFLMQDFRMIQAFLTASGTTMLLSALSSVPQCHADEDAHELMCQPVTRIKTARDKNLSGKPRGLAAVVVGAGMLGTGMALAGACPGVIYPQLGSGLPSAPYALAGAVAGVITHSIFEPVFKRTLNQWWQPKHAQTERLLGIGYTSLAIPTSLALLSMAYAAHIFLPSSYNPSSASSIFAMKEWHPILSGLTIGLIQVPSMLILHAPLGASSAMVAMVSPLARPLQWLGIIDADRELSKWNFPSVNALSKVGFGVAAILGGLLSAVASGSFGKGMGLEAAPAVLPALGWKVQAALGGWFLLLGARIAGGCTSGHGISGFGFLGITSVTAVASMFGGGILAANVLKLFS